MHRGQDGAGEHHGHQGDDRARQVAAPGEDQEDDREDGHEDRPLPGERPEPSDHAAMVAETYRVRIPFFSDTSAAPFALSLSGLGVARAGIGGSG
ncbi:hypothetical protein GCM10010260_68990 [Streptomyces filipinensis]|uniref:Uncharacterized protein n=1 Tax=Streptomyces filipinensis TaxID=66887 RepID=A0A918IK47_9ACTN|nr:hypothetical protein GCM10010260_68990 [Streptomyces filipinensis]